MLTQTDTTVWSESFCTDSMVTLLQLVQNPSTGWRYSRFCSHLLMQVSVFPQWCHSGFQPTSILIFCWFKSFSMLHCEVKTWEAYIRASSRGVTFHGWTEILQMWICDITGPWQHVRYPTVVSHKLYSDDGVYNTWSTPEFLEQDEAYGSYCWKSKRKSCAMCEQMHLITHSPSFSLQANRQGC
jgi:hypothetical protein